MKTLSKFFDRLEDSFRRFLSRYPLIYAFVGGVAVVSFWRGVWETSDLLGVSPQASLVFGLLVLMSIGTLVTEFLGNRIILSGLRGEKKLEEKTLDEIEQEERFLSTIEDRVENIERMISELLKK